MVIFKKILEYKRPLSSEGAFEYLCALTNQTIDPGSLYINKLKCEVEKVLCSSMRRAKECLDISPSSKILYLDDLREIPFELEKFCSKKDWQQGGSPLVRKKFREFFINDELLQKRKVIFSTVKSVLQEILNSNESVMVISHSFRLKVIEAFIKTGGAIESDPSLINKFIDDSSKTYEFGEGFAIDKESIKRLESIL